MYCCHPFPFNYIAKVAIWEREVYRYHLPLVPYVWSSFLWNITLGLKRTFHPALCSLSIPRGSKKTPCNAKNAHSKHGWQYRAGRGDYSRLRRGDKDIVEPWPGPHLNNPADNSLVMVRLSSLGDQVPVHSNYRWEGWTATVQTPPRKI